MKSVNKLFVKNNKLRPLINFETFGCTVTHSRCKYLTLVGLILIKNKSTQTVGVAVSSKKDSGSSIDFTIMSTIHNIYNHRFICADCSAPGKSKAVSLPRLTVHWKQTRHGRP